jgi:hypothetical protein
MQQGHQTMFVDGYPPLAVDQMILEEVEGILILSNDDEMFTWRCAVRVTRQLLRREARQSSISEFRGAPVPAGLSFARAMSPWLSHSQNP